MNSIAYPFYCKDHVHFHKCISVTHGSIQEGARLIEVVKIVQRLLTINIQQLLCTVIKLHVVKEAIQSSSSLPFSTNFNLFVNPKTLIYFSTHFKDVIQYYYFQSSPVSAK